MTQVWATRKDQPRISADGTLVALILLSALKGADLQLLPSSPLGLKSVAFGRPIGWLVPGFEPWNMRWACDRISSA